MKAEIKFFLGYYYIYNYLKYSRYPIDLTHEMYGNMKYCMWSCKKNGV